MKALLLTCCLTSAAFAAGPATRPVGLAPATPVHPREVPGAIDPTRPAFVPKFARAGNPPTALAEERRYAYRFGQPGPFLYGYGGYRSYSGFGYGGYGFGYGWRQ